MFRLALASSTILLAEAMPLREKADSDSFEDVTAAPEPGAVVPHTTHVEQEEFLLLDGESIPQGEMVLI